MQPIIYGTSNKNKLKEAKDILGIDLQPIDLKIDEVQSLDPIEVASKKAFSYYSRVNQPILVEDISLTFLALNKLPGTLIDSFFESIGNEGLVKLFHTKQDRSAIAQMTLAFIDEHGLEHLFVGEVKGKIALAPVGSNGFGWDPIFIPDGSTQTYAEMSPAQKNKFSVRKEALDKFSEWLKTVS